MGKSCVVASTDPGAVQVVLQQTGCVRVDRALGTLPYGCNNADGLGVGLADRWRRMGDRGAPCGGCSAGA